MMPVDPNGGMELDPQILIQTQSNFISQARVKEVQMEAAIQQLIGEKQELQEKIAELEALVPQDEEIAEEG